MVRWQPGGDVAKEDAIVMAGTFVESLANTDPKIQIAGGHYVLAHISGNMRKHLIRIVPDCIVPGDRVPVELSPSDLTRGCVTYHSQ
jgi:translation initiation factor IF-1